MLEIKGTKIFLFLPSRHLVTENDVSKWFFLIPGTPPDLGQLSTTCFTPPLKAKHDSPIHYNDLALICLYTIMKAISLLPGLEEGWESKRIS